MFNIEAKPTFRCTVSVNVPDGDGTRAETLRATYRALPSSTIDSMALETKDGTKEFLRAVIVSIDDIVDADGKAVAYSDQVRDAVIDLPYARNALSMAYFEEVNRVRAGN